MNNELIEQIKANVPLVYEAGYNKCLKENPPGATEEELQEKYEEGYNNGHEDGKTEGLNTAINIQEEFLADKPQTYYDLFWDVLQAKGAPARYYYRFAYPTWNDDIYNPKYNIVGIDANNTLTNLFYTSYITDTKVAIDAARVPNGLNNCFYWARQLKYIRKLIITEATTFVGAFADCKALISIDEIEGKIGQNINLKDCVLLNKGSIERLVEALSTNTTELTLTLSAEAVANAFTDAEWEALEATKTNWNISLV